MSDRYRHGPDRILVAEDDQDARRYITQVLAGRAGFDVTTAPTAAATLDLLRSQRWDVILTDIEMPGMTGLELLSEARLLAPGTPVAVITAHATVSNAVGAVRGNADDFLEKPLRPDDLVSAVRRMLALRRADGQRVLAIGAHPDDVEIGAAGVLLAHRAAGDSVSILTLSHGARGGVTDARAAEARKAAQLIGATLHLEHMADTRIPEGDPTISAIAAVVRDEQPTVLYTHSLHDVHQDHRNTHRAAMVAAREVATVYCFQSPSATTDFRPSRFMDIDAQLTGKLAAIDAFASQTAVRDYLEPDLIEATARYWSRFADGRYAEAFEVIRDGAAGPAAGDRAGTSVGPTRGRQLAEGGSYATA